MNTLSFTTARDRFSSVCDLAVSTREPVVIERLGHESVVLVPTLEWEGLLETIHLLRSPANAQRLTAALARLEDAKGEELTLASLAEKVATP